MNNERTQISLDRMIQELRQIRYLLSEVNDNVKKSNLLLEHDMSIEKTIRTLPVKKSNQLREEMFPSEETSARDPAYSWKNYEVPGLADRVKKSNQLGYPQTGENRRTWTSDRLIKSQMLYQLSYIPIKVKPT